VPNPALPPLTLGTAGHIDHGKTVLVEALTGVNTDRLPEEQARGISIELGFARLELPSGRSLSVVDVPGHERFVRTMVAGATGIDLFMLVIAADDGVMPQTLEHLAVLQTLEIPAGVVAITKADLVMPEELDRLVGDVRELLAGGPYEEAPVVTVCAPSGERLDELVAELDGQASRCSGRAGGSGELRLHVDRCFSLKGIGTVVTGTLWSGVLRVGDEVRIEPSKRVARVRSIEVHGAGRERAEAGQRVAANLAGVDWQDVERGDVLASPDGSLRPTYLVDAAVELLPGSRALPRGTRVHIHHGTRSSAARVAPLEGDELEPGARQYVQLRLERPVLPAAGDRFVLRQVAPPDTIGGGVIVDPSPRKHGPGGAQVERLELLESGDSLALLAAELGRTPSGLAPDQVTVDLAEQLCASGRAVTAGIDGRYFAPEHHDRARDALLTLVDERGGRRPISRGALADAAGLAEPAAAAVLEDLVAEGLVVARGPGFQTARQAKRGDPQAERLVEMLRDDALEPTGVEALAASLGITGEEARELLDGEVIDGRLERLKPGLYYHPDALRAAEQRVIAACARDGSVTIATLRDELSTSRKYAQALLEYFDRRRLTRRQGDEHVLRR
jgi:selenocysteine-specific elongation factor